MKKLILLTILALSLIFVASNVNAWYMMGNYYGYGQPYYGGSSYNAGYYSYPYASYYRPYYYRAANPFVFDRGLNYLENTNPLFFNRGVTYRAFDSIDFGNSYINQVPAFGGY